MTATVDPTIALANALRQVMGGSQAQFGAALPGTPTTTYVHGPGGLFSSPGLDRRVFSAMSLPNTALVNRLPVFDSNIAESLEQLLTGIASSTGTNPVNVCDDPKTSGFIYGCSIVRTFGRYTRQTPTFDIDRLTLEQRGERFDFQVIGGQNPQSPMRPTYGQSSPQDFLNNEIAANMFALGVDLLRELAQQAYIGNPSNNTAGGGYKEMQGLDLLIKQGHTDALAPATACPALDSYIYNIGGDIGTNAAAVVTAIVNMVRYVKRNAELNGLNPVQWAIIMRPGLFDALADIWPCNYATYRCGGVFVEGDGRYVDGFEVARMSAEMKQGSFLLVDDVRIPVWQDDAAPISEPVAGTYESDIYMIPLTVRGGIYTTYMEARNYDSAVNLAKMLAGNDTFRTSDGGHFLWVKKPNQNFCIQSLVKIEPRIVLRTPQLAGRVTNVQWTPLLPILGTAYPGEDGYRNGGVQVR